MGVLQEKARCLRFSIHCKGRKEDNNSIEYFLCDLCAFAVNKNPDIYLNGGEYINPPLIQRAFKPRSRPNGVFVPTLRSNTSA